MKPIIGIDISQIQYSGTGVATYTKNLVSYLLKASSEYNFLLFGTSLRGFNQLKHSVSSLPSTPTKLFPIPPTLLDILFNQLHLPSIETFTGPIDLFHSSDWTQPPSRAVKVTTIHDLTPLKYPRYQHPKTIRTFKRRLHWIKQEQVHIIADSQATKNDLVSLCRLPPQHIDVIYLAPTPSITAFAKLKRQTQRQRIEEIKHKYHLTRNFILSVGTREPRKNLSRTIKAFQRLGHHQLDFVIAGRYGWGDTPVPSHPSIKLLGYVEPNDLPPLYAAAELFIYPSLYEGFGLPVLEAMTLGVPVVTSSTGSLPEVGGTAAIYANPTSISAISTSIRQALHQSSTLSQLSRQQAHKFSWEKTASATLSVYRSLLFS